VCAGKTRRLADMHLNKSRQHPSWGPSQRVTASRTMGRLVSNHSLVIVAQWGDKVRKLWTQHRRPQCVCTWQPHCDEMDPLATVAYLKRVAEGRQSLRFGVRESRTSGLRKRLASIGQGAGEKLRQKYTATMDCLSHCHAVMPASKLNIGREK
jgi:hypothetical protein